MVTRIIHAYLLCSAMHLVPFAVEFCAPSLSDCPPGFCELKGGDWEHYAQDALLQITPAFEEL